MPSVETPFGTAGFTDHGTGPALVLVHGFLFDKTMWQPQIAHFAPLGLRVICVDLIGRGLGL